MAIALRGVTKQFHTVRALDDVSFDVRSGEVFGFLGPNGAGKTTTLRLIVGLLRPDSGSVLVDGHDVQRDPSAARRAIGFVPDEPNLYDGLTGREFLHFIADLYGTPPQQRQERLSGLVERFDLSEHLDQWIGGMSHGTRQKIALSAALLHDPSNLLLDEPTVGLDPRAAFTLKTVLRERADAGAAVMLSTHILEIAEGLCDRVGILDHGHLLAIGTVDEVRQAAGLPGASLESIFLHLTSPSGAR